MQGSGEAMKLGSLEIRDIWSLIASRPFSRFLT
jgi:hypothetical protein